MVKINYRPEIDGLRGISVLLVILYHCNIVFFERNYFSGGYLGVDIFFVISGYLITSIIYKEIITKKSFSFLNFYERRARRLLPALIVTLFISIPLAFLKLSPYELIEFAKSLIATILFTSNFYFNLISDYFGPNTSPLLHVWSLSVEEQFYFLFPIFLVLTLKYFSKFNLIILIFIFFLSLFFAHTISDNHPSFNFYMLSSRIWELMAGAIVAIIEYRYKPASKKINNIFSLIGFILIFLSIFYFDENTKHPSLLTVIPIFGVILILRFSNKNEIIYKILSTKYLVGLGLISYSLYLIHYPIFTYFDVPNISLEYKLIFIFLIIFLSTLNFYFIEKKFRNKSVVSLRFFLNSIISSIILIIIIATLTINKSGFEGRFKDLKIIYGENKFDSGFYENERAEVINQIIEDKKLYHYKYFYTSRFFKKILWFEKNENKKKILIVGNSHGYDLFNSLYLNKEIFSNLDFAYYRFQIRDIKNEKKYQEFINSPNFINSDIILLSSYYGLNKENKVDEIQDILIFSEKIKKYKKKLVVSSYSIVFEEKYGIPISNYLIEKNKIFLKNDYFKEDIFKKELFKNIDKEIIKRNERIKNLMKINNIKYLDKTDYTCSFLKKECDIFTNDGHIIYFDTDHYTLKGAKYYGKKMYDMNWLDIE